LNYLSILIYVALKCKPLISSNEIFSFKQIMESLAIQEILSDFIGNLNRKEKIEQDIVINIMSDRCGGGAATGKWNWKQATDLIESAMGLVLLQKQYQTLSEFGQLQALVSHHKVRSEEQMELQQFSTPFQLAWILRELAEVRSTDIILEPSAGTGILAAAAMSKINPKVIILNEISKSRNKLLHQVFPGALIHAIDGEYINDLIPQELKPDLVLINPPFSTSISRGKRNPEACFRHVRSALLRLKPKGRLVAIVAHWMNPEKHPEWFAKLPAQLRSSTFVEGKHYRYHGTTMDVRILVFDKLIEYKQVKSIDRVGLTIEQIADIAIGSTSPRL
jgi:16S rRNA G966 N2-methylase RsmD